MISAMMTSPISTATAPVMIPASASPSPVWVPCERRTSERPFMPSTTATSPSTPSPQHHDSTRVVMPVISAAVALLLVGRTGA